MFNIHLKHFRNNNGNVVYNFLTSGEKTEFKMSVKEYRNIQRSRKSMISRKNKIRWHPNISVIRIK